jgi:hypothetical protein
MPRAERRTDLLHPFRRHPDGIAASFRLAFGFQVPVSLFLLAIRRPPVIGTAFDVEPGMGQRAESGGQVFEALVEQDSGQGMHHLALQTDLDRSGPVELAVLGFDRHHDMNQLMHEDAEDFDRLGEIGADEDFKVTIGGG